MEVDILTEVEKKIPERNMIFVKEETEHLVNHNLSFLIPPDEILKENIQSQIDHYFPAFKDYDLKIDIKVNLSKK
jgi:hypothetical protein